MGLRALLIIGIIGCSGSSQVQRPTSTTEQAAANSPVVRHAEILAIMERFLTSPSTSDPGDLKRIREFTAQSPDVVVEIDPICVPVMEDLDRSVKNLLVIGFLAGDAASQLRAGVKRDDRIAGVEGELAIYRVLKALSTTQLKGRKVISPRLDALLGLRARGQLRAYLEGTPAGRVSGEVATGSVGPPDAPASDPAALSAATPGRPDSAAGKDPDEARTKRVLIAQRLVQVGRAEDAITDYLDKVISSYEVQYATDKRHIYCAHDRAETLAYLTGAASKAENAVALGPTWAEAWFIKSYALTELHRTAEALAALEKALALSPSYSHYLSERGYFYYQAKDWQHSLEVYRAAEDAVGLISNQQVQIIERTRALRGEGYALVELGDLDAGEAKYQQSLALNPDDTLSKQELEHIKHLRATQN